MSNMDYIRVGDNVTLVIDGIPQTINRTDRRFVELVKALDTGTDQEVLEILNRSSVTAKEVEKEVDGLVIGDQEITYNGREIKGSLAKRIRENLDTGYGDRLVKFFENLIQNPSASSVNELYDFLEISNSPITEDGHFLAYKNVRGDYFDIYTGTMNNSPGQVLEISRNEVDDNRRNECSFGLHFAAYGYLGSYRQGSDTRTVVLKINPRDVVAIPEDYSCQKGRTCRYEVIKDITPEARNEETAIEEMDEIAQTNLSEFDYDIEREVFESIVADCESDGDTIDTRTSTEPGTYRVRFIRINGDFEEDDAEAIVDFIEESYSECFEEDAYDLKVIRQQAGYVSVKLTFDRV